MKKLFKDSVSEDIARIMRGQNMSRKELAKRMGVSEALVSGHLCDPGHMSLNTVSRIYEALYA